MKQARHDLSKGGMYEIMVHDGRDCQIRRVVHADAKNRADFSISDAMSRS